MKIRKIEKSLGQWLDEQGLEVVVKGKEVFIGNEKCGYSLQSQSGIIEFLSRMSLESRMIDFEYSGPSTKSYASCSCCVEYIMIPKGIVFSGREVDQLLEIEC